MTPNDPPQPGRKDIDFVCDRDSGRVWILHGKPFRSQENLQKALFDPATGFVTLLDAQGRRQILSVAVKPPLTENFSNATHVTLLWTDKGEVFDMHLLPLMIGA